ncbi:DUF4097 family beta strand repeat-containing protein [Nocardiopsis suaedae]|uniref:DUF4097 family beta strand repeat-containing protein n=1 Tax=Nocardiopsis suaedae TaxID=3018444 RepID=A0ABT4TPG1_9ACTN|nr:DUF4097 family beta strand repeat-containing protein [Nocardiopsis suaedae]MDA2806521.1 DUF4097 family beta strand repeat-containing protein [Nocardiopsis suaedae]
MPEFATPEPITADIDVVAGGVLLNATDRTDTVVEVRPRDPGKDADVRAAERVQVDFGNGRLTVASQKSSAVGRMLQKGMVEVTVELPAESHVRATTGYGSIRCEGRVGTTRITTSASNITVDRASGNAELTTANGWVRANTIDGSATVKNTNGSITLGTVTGPLRMATSHGDLSAERALDSVEARTPYGVIRIGEVVRGSVNLQSNYGEVEIGIREGTAAWLDADSEHGTVHTSLNASEGPEAAEETVEVYARTSYGDVVVRRA